MIHAPFYNRNSDIDSSSVSYIIKSIILARYEWFFSFINLYTSMMLQYVSWIVELLFPWLLED